MILYMIRKCEFLVVLGEFFDIYAVILRRVGCYSHTWDGYFISRIMSAWN